MLLRPAGRLMGGRKVFFSWKMPTIKLRVEMITIIRRLVIYAVQITNYICRGRAGKQHHHHPSSPFLNNLWSIEPLKNNFPLLPFPLVVVVLCFL